MKLPYLDITAKLATTVTPRLKAPIHTRAMAIALIKGTGDTTRPLDTCRHNTITAKTLSKILKTLAEYLNRQ